MNDSQLTLFGDGAAAPATPALVPAASPSASVVATARDLPANVWLGTSSWSFPGWAGLVYGRAATTSELAWRGLDAYARHPLLSAVGVDRSYYAPVPPGDFVAYRSQVEAGLASRSEGGGPTSPRWLVKMTRDFTLPWVKKGRNPMVFNGPLALSASVLPAVETLGRGETIVLVQLSPMGKALGGPERFPERLRAFLDVLTPHARIAVELRDTALLTPGYLAVLKETGALHCLNLLPELPGPLEQATLLRQAYGDLGPSLLVRWLRSGGLAHDVAESAYEPYDRLCAPEDGLCDAVAGLAREASGQGKEVIIVVDNKAEGSAPLTVARLAERIVARPPLRSASVPAP